MAVKLQFRRDTAANWESNNTILSEGELGLDTTNQRFKIGDGVNGWNDIDNAQYTNKAETFEATISILENEWALETSGPFENTFVVTKTVSGVITTDFPIIDLDLSSATTSTFDALQAEFSGIIRAEVVANNQIKFYSGSTISEDLPIVIKVVR